MNSFPNELYAIGKLSLEMWMIDKRLLHFP